MKILIFTEGTILKHSNTRDLSREDIVKQSQNGVDFSLKDWINYVPIGNAVNKLNIWKSQGADIMYLTSRTRSEEIESIFNVIQRNSFPQGQLLFRGPYEEYKDIVERILPDILIEDDCESIGGKKMTIYPNIRPIIQEKIKSITVREFEGVDHLPDDLFHLSVI